MGGMYQDIVISSCSGWCSGEGAIRDRKTEQMSLGELGGNKRNNLRIFNDPPRQVSAYYFFGLNCFTMASLLLPQMRVSAAEC